MLLHQVFNFEVIIVKDAAALEGTVRLHLHEPWLTARLSELKTSNLTHSHVLI